jgi:hypothetical protein
MLGAPNHSSAFRIGIDRQCSALVLHAINPSARKRTSLIESIVNSVSAMHLRPSHPIAPSVVLMVITIAAVEINYGGRVAWHE